MQKQLRFLGILLISLFLAQATKAQNVTGATISGIVMDSKGGPAPGATVIATHTPSGTQYGTACDADGRFTIPAVRVGGPYSIVATVMGNKKELNDVNLTLGQIYYARIQLTESNVELKAVSIVANKSNIMNDKRTGAGTTISNNELTSIPSINRSLSDVTKLTPQSSGLNFAGRNSLYNNVTLDGALFNNPFGLASTVGGQTNSEPFSLEAIDQVQVNIAPFDVRQTNFTGAGVNAVTKSGDNTLRASAFIFYRDQSFIGNKVDTNPKITNPNLKHIQTGVTVSGPIIKNKLFFFGSFEADQRTDPGSSFVANRGTTGTNVSTVKATTMDSLSSFLNSRFGYSTGAYDNYNFLTQSDKISLKLDYNIDSKDKLSVRYNYLYSRNQNQPSSRGPSSTRLPFENADYYINNNMNSIIAELDSRISNKIFNNLTAGYTGLRDYRTLLSSIFPTVDIKDAAHNFNTTFGTEPFTPNNKLNSDIYQATDNLSIYFPKNIVTAGVDFQYNAFVNGFTPNFYGDYTFSSLASFYNSMPKGTITPIGPSTGTGTPSAYALQYSIVNGDNAPLAKLQIGQVGFYGQDEIQALKNLKVTVGLRVDLPFYPTKLQSNDSVAKLNFLSSDNNTISQKIDVSKYPNVNPLYSPRVGFNWDVMNDNTFKVRGGTGVFTGHIPFVWISNQASNNGVLYGNISNSGANASKDTFSTNVNKYIPATKSGNSTVLINITDPKFKFPQVWRTSLGVDKQLPWGIIASLDLLYTKDINAVYHRDINLKPSTSNFSDGTSDNRPIYAYYKGASYSSANNRINPYVTNAIEVTNTNQGYSSFVTLNLQKEFNKNWYATAAYTYGQTKDITSNPGSVAFSAFQYLPGSGNPNDPKLAYSDYDMHGRFILGGSYKFEYAKKMLATTLSLFYNYYQIGRVSFTYNGDMNGDGMSSNDLIYIPKSQAEAASILEDIKGGATAATQAQYLWAFIQQDKYLSKHEGQIADRNGELYPWRGQIDVKVAEDVTFHTGKEKHKFQVTLDILNFGNLLNSKWGVSKSFAPSSGLLNVISNGKPYNATTNASQYDPVLNPKYQFPMINATTPVYTHTFIENISTSSLWLMQIGIRYNFN